MTPCVYLLHSPLEKDTIGTFTRFFHQFTSPLDQHQTSSSPWRTYCIIVACSPWSMHCIKLWCSPWNIYSPRSNTNLCWNSVLSDMLSCRRIVSISTHVRKDTHAHKRIRVPPNYPTQYEFLCAVWTWYQDATEFLLMWDHRPLISSSIRDSQSGTPAVKAK